MSDLIVTSDPEWSAERHSKALCDYFGETLAREYPGYRWRVEAKPKAGIVDIRCEHAQGTAADGKRGGSYGYTFNLRRHGLPERSAVVMAGGEILERFKLSRRAFSEEQFRSLPRWLGQLLPDL